jgi:hypothetical protein
MRAPIGAYLLICRSGTQQKNSFSAPLSIPWVAPGTATDEFLPAAMFLRTPRDKIRSELGFEFRRGQECLLPLGFEHPRWIKGLPEGRTTIAPTFSTLGLAWLEGQVPKMADVCRITPAVAIEPSFRLVQLSNISQRLSTPLVIQKSGFALLMNAAIHEKPSRYEFLHSPRFRRLSQTP